MKGMIKIATIKSSITANAPASAQGLGNTRQQEITDVLISNYEHRSGSYVEDGSDTAIKLYVIAGAIGELLDKYDYFDKQIYPNTADGEYLVRHGNAKGIYKKLATKSTGYVTFYTRYNSTEDIVIPSGTLCTSSSVPNALYETTKEVTLPKGESHVSAPIQSVESGSIYNIAVGYIDILVSPITGIASIKNTVKVTGGADEEPDQMFRQRVIESYQMLSNGANINYYQQWAKAQPDVWHSKAVPDPTTSNHIRLYVENATRTISDDTISWIQQEVEDIRALGMRVTVLRPTKKLVNMSITAYVDSLSNQAQYHSQLDSIITEYIQSLSVGSRLSLSALSALLLKAPGVLDITITSPTVPISVSGNEIVTRGDIAIAFLKA